MVLFIMLYKVVLTFESVDEILKCDHSNESYSNDQYFPVVMFITLYKVVLNLNPDVSIHMKVIEPNFQFPFEPFET